MRTRSHLAKFQRLDAMLGRLDPIADQELWVWTAMNACVNLFNAALHQSGVTDESDSFHTQVEGVYAVPDRTTRLTQDAMLAPGDVMHVGQPALPGAVPPAIRRAGDALHVIEDLRETHVRGPKRAQPDDVREWRDAYATCVRELSALLRETGCGT